jgi:phage terminase small subunit
MPEEAWKAIRDATGQKCSTVGKRSGARRRSGQMLALLEDPRERRFIERYVETNHGTQSAIVAGYSVKSARTIASQLLKRRNIKEAIERRNAELMDELNFTPDRIIRELAKIAGVNSADFIRIDQDGQPRVDFSGVTRRHLAAVASVENTEKGVKYKTHDKLRALDMLARMGQLYPAERLEHTGVDGGPIATTHRIDIESLSIEQREQLRDVLLALKAKQVEAQVRLDKLPVS